LDDIYRQIKYEEHIKKSAELMLKALREEASEENDDELNETRDTTNVTAVLSATRLETGFRIGETNGQTERELREMKKSQLEQQVKEADEKIEMLKKQADLIQQLAQRMEEEKEDEQALYRNVSDTFGVDYYIQSNFPNDENLDPRQRALRHRDVIVVPKHYFMEEEEKTPLNDQIITTPVAQPSLPASVPEKLSDWHQASPTPSVETVSAQSLPIISSSQTNHTELPMDTLRLYHTTNPLPRKSSVSSIAPHTDVNALDDKMRPEFTGKCE
jgi:molybdopterin converting factor small subunit